MLACDIQLDGSQINVVLDRIAGGLGHLGRVAAGRLSHAGVDGVPRIGESTGGERAEAAGRAGDDDNLFHDCDPLL
jgi:hypothetical protein